MIKDVLVNLATGTVRDPAADYAISIARAFDAHIAAVAFAFESVIPELAAGGVAADIINGARIENERAAKASLSSFDSSATKQGLSAETHCITHILAEAVDHFGWLARRFDLSVVAQADPDKTGPEVLYAQAALFDSGRPVVVVPYIQKAPLALDRVVCCWDGSRTAARAIADASPFLAKAKTVDLLIVSTEKVMANATAGTDMAQHLARRGSKVNVQHIKAHDIDVGNAILSYAADASADFLVMGGYGHSRLREFVLGGVTRSILSSMTLPTLMSH